ncbi:UDP-N-acetylmuramoyl-tripeptide--D-alanyl-D-alanine ligase [Colwellia sp. KU-HH00111]|uniref:UDP-N-acetylmuramoyl-tripeptide--D-alanyl-D- alanine ligase n=1 Tax=Colwellia sp. KU-HH00111 TaxID=3127652 RepID=UPI00310686AF
MINLTLTTLATACNGQLVCQQALKAISVENLVTDSRALKAKEEQVPGHLAFLALKGPNFDGHRFAKQVVAQGCQVLIVDHLIADLEQANVAQIVVEDTRIALGQIAAYVKQQVAPKTVGITGSSGKTTVKEMLAAILSRLGKVLATQGNFNNDIGVPLTLLRLEHAHDFAVIEMGANHIGEIAYTTALVKPDVAMINNIAAAHLEGFGDLCGVARAKGEIFAGLSAEGVALYNKDTKYTSKWQWRLTDKQVRTFSCLNPINADCYSSNVVLDENGCAQFELQTSIGHCNIMLTVPGKHNVCNAVAAATAAIECGASLQDIQLGLAQMTPVKGRLNIHHLPQTTTCAAIKLIDDTYNANVESIKAAISLLANYNGQRILVLGDMGELGCEARRYHQEIGEFAKEQGIEVLLTLGVLSQSTSDAFAQNNDAISEHFSERNLLEETLFELLSHKDQIIKEKLNANNSEHDSTTERNKVAQVQILVKGSRSAHMEYVVEGLVNWHARQPKNQLVNPANNSVNKQEKA